MSRGESGVGQPGVNERRHRGGEGGRETDNSIRIQYPQRFVHISAGGDDDCFHLMSLFFLLTGQKPKNNAVSLLFCALKSFFTHRDS